MQVERNLIVQVLHKVPHINVSLHLVDNTFNPSSQAYVEVSWEKKKKIEIEMEKIFYIFSLLLHDWIECLSDEIVQKLHFNTLVLILAFHPKVMSVWRVKFYNKNNYYFFLAQKYVLTGNVHLRCLFFYQYFSHSLMVFFCE
jgi:hypothetical protein